jgi:hypothetical protein
VSITTTSSITTAHDDGHAEHWRQWQLAYANSNRRTASQARIVFAIVMCATTAWLAFQIFLSPAWN